jgi:Mce-associated membrane protein
MSRAFATVGTVAAIVAAGGGALAAVQTHRLSDAQAGANAREQAVAAASQIAVDFLAYDYRHIDADFNRVTNESVGALQKDFATQSAGVRSLIVQAKAVSTATVAGAGFVNGTTNSARVVVSLNRNVVNTSAPNGQANAVDLQIDLVRRNGRWLASQVKPL